MRLKARLLPYAEFKGAWGRETARGSATRRNPRGRLRMGPPVARSSDIAVGGPRRHFERQRYHKIG